MINNRVEEIEKHIKAISEILGIKPTESNCDTPLRVAKMYCNELFKNLNDYNIEDLNSKMKLFDACGNMPIILRGIKFNSTCEHHWLPFMGIAEVSYKPTDKIIGLSKIPRVVKYFSQKPQLQERLTNEIGEYLFNLLKPEWIHIKLIATHTCVMCRGAESECETETNYYKFTKEDDTSPYPILPTGGLYVKPEELGTAFGIPASEFNGGTTPV